MKYNCDLIKDLIPLYADDVCSTESRRAVDEHIAECVDCKEFLNSIVAEDVPVAKGDSENNNVSAESLRNVKKKWSRGKRIGVIFGIIGGILATMATYYLGIMGAAIGLLFAGSIVAKPEVTDTVTMDAYDACIISLEPQADGVERTNAFSGIFPTEVSSGATLTEFKYTYYNPFDAQYLTYATFEYDASSYEAEILRLNAIGVSGLYKDYYSVTGAPKGYELVAMTPDPYSGFVYAIIPLENADTEITSDGTYKITYVGLQFCNYFLDIDVEECIPQAYILEGFNAKNDNPYMKECVG